MSIKNVFEEMKNQRVTIQGWVVSNRGNQKIRFLSVNDGSTISNMQVVIKNSTAEEDQLRMGSPVKVTGEFVLTPQNAQPGEITATKVQIMQNVSQSYPLQKQSMTREFLREIPHLRQRTNLFRAIMRVKSQLAVEIHRFFESKNFLLLAAPIITSNDGEGAGETFVVDDEKGNFFGRKATLGVTGQLHAEAYALGFKKVYTFAPTFRAEYSNTKRHAAEFWMVEPEVAFCNLSQIVKLADQLVKTVIKNTMNRLQPEFNFLNNQVDDNLLSKLKKVVENKIVVLDYADAIKELEKQKSVFANKKIWFGMDLSIEHERYLANDFAKGPVAVVNYPKNTKAFYMHQNSDNKTVAAFDLLVPGVGELIGGSQREANVEKLKTRMRELNIDQTGLEWYLNLRNYGLCQSSGFGVGFERLVMYVTGVDNIKDVIPFPRTARNLKM